MTGVDCDQTVMDANTKNGDIIAFMLNEVISIQFNGKPGQTKTGCKN